MMVLVPDSYGVELQEFNPCHAPAGQPTGGRFCSDKIPGRSQRLIDASRKIVDAITGRDGVDLNLSDELSAAQREQVSQVMRMGLAGATARVRLPVEVLELVLQDGRMKNQFESKTSRGYFDVDELDNENYYRRRLEQTVMGIEQAFPGKDRPIYGTLSVSKDDGGTSYGDVVFELNEDVTARTTFTVGDSFGLGVNKTTKFGNGFFPIGVAEPVNAPTWRAIAPGQRNTMAEALKGVTLTPEIAKNVMRDGYYGYIEAQIHGGVRLKDIKVIRFPRGNWGESRASLEGALSNASGPASQASYIRDLLTKAGFEERKGYSPTFRGAEYSSDEEWQWHRKGA